MSDGHRDNLPVAEMLREMARLLEAQNGNRYRVAAYRHAADSLMAMPASVREVFERGGVAGLDALPTVGSGIAAAIGEILVTGRWRRLERLRGELDGGAVFRAIPGVGPQLSLRLHDELGVDTLEALEIAAHDGRLEHLAHLGPRRAAAIRAALTQLLDRNRTLRRSAARLSPEVPPVESLLDVDREYRAAAEAGLLPTIAPRRFNPTGEAWLPVLHTRRGQRRYTALFSNTARAHRAGRTRDWVVVYLDDGPGDHQFTVITALRGALRGQRVVAGRESEG
jgi:hypothetical protein